MEFCVGLRRATVLCSFNTSRAVWILPLRAEQCPSSSLAVDMM